MDGYTWWPTCIYGRGMPTPDKSVCFEAYQIKSVNSVINMTQARSMLTVGHHTL